MRGLTLVEVLIAMGLATVVGALLVVIMVNSAGLFYTQSSRVSQGLGVNDALSKIRSSIKESNAVAASFSTGGTTYSSSGSEIVLKIPSVDALGTIISNTFDFIVIVKDTNKLRYKFFPDTLSSRKSQDQIFSTSLDSLTFQYLDSQNPPSEVAPTAATKVRIVLSLKQKNAQTFEMSTATSEANLRND